MTATTSDEEAPLVLIVDDDVEVRTAIGELMESVGIKAVTYGSTRDLLETPLPDRAGCPEPVGWTCSNNSPAPGLRSRSCS